MSFCKSVDGKAGFKLTYILFFNGFLMLLFPNGKWSEWVIGIVFDNIDEVWKAKSQLVDQSEKSDC